MPAAFRALVDALKWLAGVAIWMLVLVVPLAALVVAPVVILVVVLRRRKRAKRESVG
ncbi:MAG: hypothetical protein ACYC9N_20525 [Thermoanaerobaculia bacterium]